jgi:hypothetical protein
MSMRDEYDLSELKGAVRGKHAESRSAGTNLVLLQPDVAEAFPDAESVNEALRALLEGCCARQRRRPTKPGLAAHDGEGPIR